MRYYLAYKYKAIPDKERLQSDLISISEALKENGHEVFILGKDVQNWKNSSAPLIKTLPAIFKHLAKSDKIIVYLESEVKSRGLHLEMLFSKIFRKPVVLLHKHEVKIDTVITPTQTIKFTHITDLLVEVKKL